MVSHITKVSEQLEVDWGPETLKSALLLKPTHCATCSGAAAPHCSELTSSQAAAERNGLALICAAGMRARVTAEGWRSSSFHFSPAESWLCLSVYLIFFFHRDQFPDVASCLAA